MPAFFKDSAELVGLPLPPQRPLDLNGLSQTSAALARVYNRLGGLLTRLSDMTRTSVPAALAVWYVESGGKNWMQGGMVIRFEVHKLFAHWGSQNADGFDRHFRFGGRGTTPGKAWENHAYRQDAAGAFRRCHVGSQSTEYEVLALAQHLPGDEPALLSISMGGPQIMGFNFAKIGYGSVKAMHDAFQRDERAHVLGFYDFCSTRRALPAMAAEDWLRFAELYNGAGKAASYAGRIEAHLATAAALLRDQLPHKPQVGDTIKALRQTFLYEQASSLSRRLGSITAGMTAKLLDPPDALFWKVEVPDGLRGYIVAEAFA